MTDTHNSLSECLFNAPRTIKACHYYMDDVGRSKQTLLKFAHTHEWIDKLPAVPFLAEALTRRRRRDFTSEEYQLLRKTAIKRIRNLPADKSAAEQRHIKHQRQLLYDVIQLLANSGLRVDEMRSVTWRCVDWSNGDIILERAGKRRSSRRLVLMRPAVRALLRLAQRRQNWQRLNAEPVMLHSDEKVIALPNGKAIRQLDTGFDLLLKACGFRYAEAINKHALTSLRHTYATRALTRKSTNKISTHVLSLQMGTSDASMSHAQPACLYAAETAHQTTKACHYYVDDVGRSVCARGAHHSLHC